MVRQLVAVYFTRIHPCMPFVDKISFLSDLWRSRPSTDIEPLAWLMCALACRTKEDTDRDWNELGILYYGQAKRHIELQRIPTLATGQVLSWSEGSPRLMIATSSVQCFVLESKFMETCSIQNYSIRCYARHAVALRYAKMVGVEHPGAFEDAHSQLVALRTWQLCGCLSEFCVG
jgi:hypothetical protein